MWTARIRPLAKIAATSSVCIALLASRARAQSERTWPVWFPQLGDPAKPSEFVEEAQIALILRDGTLERQLGARRVDSDEELSRLLRNLCEDNRRLLKKPVDPCIVLAPAATPWRDVLVVVDLAQRAGVGPFAFEAAEPRLRQPRLVRIPPREPPPLTSARAVSVRVIHRPALVCACSAHERKASCADLSHWGVEIDGGACRDDETIARLSRAASSDPAHAGAVVSRADRTVVIRAEPLAPFGGITRLIADCAKAGLVRVEVGATAN